MPRPRPPLPPVIRATRPVRSNRLPLLLVIVPLLVAAHYRLMSGRTATKAGAKTSDTIAISLSRMFRLGPEVSLNGSPTTSPSTAAL